ncbi:hypothetical protein [Marilutibacter alkalisoli]|uniref:DUF4760 domain-containing protein n=1 Tax=Marilutibacter alkalisoli TaxID=2591633 RepID=A0A514BTQ7_9GAMM|nr:hypothetical protein [Lysobacter alkalisoli]QDH70756.1 hypothetical protein FKV23_12190 [Lysobacter alkalisoli]
MICQEVIRGLITLTVGLIVARVGLWIYFRQKEYELVKQRYLEQSVDLIAAELESVSGAFNHNWARCLHVLKEYRDSEEQFDRDQLNDGFTPLSGSNFHRQAHHRLRTLVQSNTFWDAYQVALSFYHSANAVIVKEIPHAIRAKFSGNVGAPHSEIVSRAYDELAKLHRESERFAPLLGSLQAIASELEQENLSFKQVRTFHRRKVTLDAVEDLNTSFSKDFEKHEFTP